MTEPSSLPDAVTDSTDTTLDQFLLDPLGALAAARAQGWIAGAEPFPIVTGYDDVRELLADPRLRAGFGDVMHLLGVTAGPFHDWMLSSPLNMDGEEHRRWRSVMSRTFTPRSVDRLRPYMEATANTLIDRFAEAGSCELVADFADVFPSLCMCELIGVPEADRDRFRGWANTVGYGFSPVTMVVHLAEIDDALEQLLAFADELIARRRAEPADDLVTRIAHASIDEGDGEGEGGGDVPGDALPDELVRGSIAGLVFAGHETTKNQIGWMVAGLADHPDVWDAVGRGDLDAGEVVEESLRHRSTVTGVGRRVAEPVERHGTEVAAGTNVLLSLWGADHDPSTFPDHDSFRPGDPAHAASPHLAFGHGPHHCLGAALARAELREALRALTARLTCPTVGDGAAWKPPIGITGPERLPLTFTARPRP